MSIKSFLAKCAVLVVLSVAALNPNIARAGDLEGGGGEEGGGSECTGTIESVSPGITHCCINNSCSWGREKKYAGIEIFYTSGCSTYDFHFNDVGCCGFFEN
jgi:hypothetical protein